MKRKLLFLLIAGLITTIAFSQKKETRSVSGFTGINASSVFNITVVKGASESLTIETDNDVMQYVRSEVRNGTLHLYIDNGNKVQNIKKLNASVVMKNLDNVLLSGVCKFTANDLFTPEKFKLEGSGASNITVNVNTGHLTIEASGACNIQIKANVTGDANFNLSGAAKVQAALKAYNTGLTFSGVCSIELTGEATNMEMVISGTSKVKAENFAVKTAFIKSSGTSSVTMNVSDTLKVNSSGTASVNYKGSPTLETNVGSASKVRKI